MSKTGRRPGPTRTRQQILDTARVQFADRGYDKTTLRSIAEAADVHPALLHHYFGTKQRLYRDAFDLPIDPLEVLDLLIEKTPREQFTEALVRHFIVTWRARETGPWSRAVTRDMFADPDGPGRLRMHWEELIIPRVAAALGIPRRNAAAALGCLYGLVLADSLFGIAPLQEMSEDELVALATPALASYFHPAQ